MTTNNGPDIVKDGIVLCLDATNRKSYPGSGTTWYDISGNSNHGTIYNDPTYYPTLNNGIFHLDGVDNYIVCNNSSTLQVTGDQTLEFIIYPTTRSVRQNWYDKCYGGEGTITYEPNGSLNYYYGTAGTNALPYQAVLTTGTPLATLNQFYHVILVRDLTNMQIHWYINGSLNNTVTASYAAATASSLPITIGDGYTEPFQGKILFVRQYNIALTQSQVTQNYAAARERMSIVAGTSKKYPAPNASIIKQYNPSATSGYYWIQPPTSSSPYYTYCDLTSNDGGWMLLINVAANNGGQYYSTSTSYGLSTINDMSNVVEFDKSTTSKLSTNSINEFLNQPGTKVTWVEPKRSNSYTYMTGFFQRSTLSDPMWGTSTIECSQIFNITGNPKLDWLRTNYGSWTDARDGTNGLVGNYGGASHYYPSPYPNGQTFWKGSGDGIRFGQPWNNNTTYENISSGYLWLKIQ